MECIYSAVLAVILTLIVLYVFNDWNTTPKNFPPGPKPLPIIGNLHIINLRKPYLTLMELSKTYGSVFSIQMGMKKMVVLTGYETVKNALVNHAEEFGERAKVPVFENMNKGMGLIFSHGDNWKAMRRFTIMTLRDFGMGKCTIEDRILEECDHVAQKFQSFNGQPFDNSVVLNAAVGNIIVTIVLGHRMDYEDPTFLRLLRLTNENIRLGGSPMSSLYNMFPGIIGLFPGSHKTIMTNLAEINEFITKTFVSHLKDLDVDDKRSFIDAFLVKQQEEKNNDHSYYHNKNLLSLVRNLFSAGLETTATTLRWGLLLMTKYPDIQEKVQKEIETVIGNLHPKYDHRHQMPYTNAVIHEIQRFANIVPMNLPHQTIKDVNFMGYFLPEGTFIIPLLTSVLYDETQFKEPQQFNPQHFLDSKGNFVKSDAFMPFSAGRRVCAGENLAKMELFLFFTSFLQKFTFRKPPYVKDVDLTAAVGITTPPRPHKICATVRHLLTAPETVTMECIYSVVLAVILALIVIYVFNDWNTTPKNFPPGPKPLPIIGNLHIINLKKPYLTLMELSKTYGSVFSIQMGMKKMVVLTGYETVKNALVNHAEEFGERAKVPLFEKMDKGMGLLFSHGDNWKAMRRFTIMTLRDFGMGKRTIEDRILEECDHVVQKFQSFTGQPFDNSVVMNAAVGNIIVTIALGHRMDYEDPTFLRLLRLTNENVRLGASPMISLYNMFPGIIGLFPGNHKTIITNLAKINEFITKTFVSHLKELDVDDKRSFIDAFLVKQQEEKNNDHSYYHNKNLLSLVRNLFSAGMETTATTLRWGLLLMTKYPDIQEKVQKEIETVIGNLQPKYDHRHHMPYTNAVIHEIQRFANIVPMNLPHQTTKDVNFMGYFLPEGTFIIPLLASVLYDETQFKEPQQFNPQHFLDSKGNFVKSDAFMPFSAGRRVCAGENLAKMELFLFFTSLLQKFTFRKPPYVKDVDLTAAVGITTPPRPHKICAIVRH
ncbi:uncharacterized protein LOC142143092 [Mixophyes fleayi]|uniref:uncharacterized protein LOC142143092 n=1 Tax=Mixophyes fleayi TaxID=3061075 RepID=UPI003F4E33EE